MLAKKCTYAPHNKYSHKFKKRKEAPPFSIIPYTLFCITNMNQQSNSPKVVTFSHFSELAYIPKDHDPKKWHSSEDMEGFRRALAVDVRRVSRELQEDFLRNLTSSASEHARNPSRQYECLGIEMFVTEGLAKKIQDTRCAHVKAILNEQALQRRQGICDAEKLSSVSKKSNWSAKRARIVAMSKWLEDNFEK